MATFSAADRLAGRPGPTFSELSRAAGASELHGAVNLPVTSVAYDSRKATPGALFVALPGDYVDGHDYLRDALSRGAVAALVERVTPDLEGFRAWARVDNTREALAPLAAAFYDNPGDSLGVIGVTGTDGKTTTTYLIDAMLRAAGHTTGMIGTVAIRIADELVDHDTRQTTPESLDVQQLLAEMRASRVDWAVLEATSHALALYRLNCCPFDIGVVTNVTREHLDFHGDIEGYRAAKARLLQRVRDRDDRPYATGAVLNADDEGTLAIAHERGDVRTVWYSSRGPQVDLRAEAVEQHARGTRFRLRAGDDVATVDLKLIGLFNVENALAAAGVGRLLGLSLGQIAVGLGSLRSVPGRLQRVDAGQPFQVVVDYAHSPASLRLAIELVRNVTRGRVIAVFGSAGERDRGKRAVQGRVSAELADVSILTSEDPRFEDPMSIIDQIAGGAREIGAREGRDYYRIENRRLAIEQAFSLARPGDAVLLAGKGHEQCMIYGSQRRPWDETTEAREALAALGYTSGPEVEKGPS
jgi:UDP-N-acetylmuramoyl-L-alanyl-D-glutamate--2,6-diaminopimelate ligase